MSKKILKNIAIKITKYLVIWLVKKAVELL
jgi:hypothetical protein